MQDLLSGPPNTQRNQECLLTAPPIRCFFKRDISTGTEHFNKNIDMEHNKAFQQRLQVLFFFI